MRAAKAKERDELSKEFQRQRGQLWNVKAISSRVQCRVEKTRPRKWKERYLYFSSIKRWRQAHEHVDQEVLGAGAITLDLEVISIDCGGAVYLILARTACSPGSQTMPTKEGRRNREKGLRLYPVTLPLKRRQECNARLVDCESRPAQVRRVDGSMFISAGHVVSD